MFEAVPQVPDFVELETEIAARWERDRVFPRSMEQRAGSSEFVFYEGPPTANGRPGLHHVWARVYKDMVCRFQTMRGHLVERHAGWDTHGLPVEVEVEKQLGFSGKDEIERYGIARFVEACRASVRTYVDEWERLTARIGFGVDMTRAYWTLDPTYVQSVWWHLRQLWDKGLLFEDVKVVPYCPRCGTALSSHELGQEDVYRDVTDLSAYVKLPIEGRGPEGAEALVVWTTTPWTLVSNVGVAANPDLDYVVIDGLVVAEARADAVLGEGATARVTARLKGRDLAGVHYRRPLDLVAPPEGADGWRVIEASFVTAEEGTGLVHLAPAFGADDWYAARREGLPTINPVGPDGHFTEAGVLSGRFVKEVDHEIVDMLAERGVLLRAEDYLHSYPHCWRCRSALIYWGKPSWYVATQSRKHDLIAANETVNWRPETVKHGRFGEWLENNVDWALSRDRFWGTPLPIWRCEEGHTICISSLEDLSQHAGRDVTGVDPHRPAIDEVTIPCAECGGTARRVEAVIDAWFDSGSMPAAQWGYPHVPGSEHRLRIPADFICEAVDQTRGWFYSLLAVNLLVHGKTPYRTVLSLGHIVDVDGKKMSKSLGNTIDPWEILDSRGADPLRWWMFHQGSPWTATRTSLEAIDTSTADMPMTLWNTWSFFTTYARLNGFDPTDPGIPAPEARDLFDRWLASRQSVTITEVTEALERYDPVRAADAIATFVDDLSNWYVRCNRRRFWRTDPALGTTSVLSAQASLHEALVTVATLLAPFCPFLADRMWRELTGANGDDSVHLADWPNARLERQDLELEREMDLARRLVAFGRSARDQAGVRVRQPLRRALVAAPPGAPRVLAEIVCDELNVDIVESVTEVGSLVRYELVPNFRTLGPRLGARVQEARGALAALDAALVAATVQAGEGFSVLIGGETVELTPADVEVRISSPEGFDVATDGTVAVALDLEIDDELRARGLARDIVRQVQSLRREGGLELSDRIELVLWGVDDLAAHFAAIGRDVLAVRVEAGSGDAAPDASPIELDDGRAASVSVQKVVGA